MVKYDALEVERKWQKNWKEWELWKFDPESTKEPYVIDNPPRYASGGLHMGHAAHYTHIDFAARYKRMRGFNVLFPLCFDVNGMPIEVNVEKKHGIQMRETDRQEFIKLCSEFAQENIEEMTKQFEILGESMDPSVYYQTDAPYYRRLTQISFIRMFKDGHVYKGEAPVNWCPRCATAIADAEVEYKDRQTMLNYILFKRTDGNGSVQIATTRPELLCTCQMVAVHPDDETKKELVGKWLETPVFEREVEVRADNKVDPEFGTGNVMVCTIGDKDDLEWVYRYKLPIQMGIDQQGNMTELAGEYEGLSVKEARKRIIDHMKEKGLLVKQEPLSQNVGCCWRCKTPIEFIQAPQWFLKSLDLKDKVLETSDELNWHPDFMKLRLKDWTESLNRDWVISRQRYFATPIPLWECAGCGEVVLAEESQCYVDPTVDKPPVEKCPKEGCGGKLVGCDYVFDTWMDSSISPLYCSFWERDEELFKKLYPTSLRPQSHDIIRTWTFYTILRDTLLTGKKPWNDVMIDGFILAEDGRPMHASDGNVVDPLKIINEHGADPLRFFAATCGLGIDTPVRIQDVTRGRKLITKFANLNSLIDSALKGRKRAPKANFEELALLDRWILSRYAETVAKVTQYCEKYQFDRAVKEIDNFIWHELADHYLEMVKHRIRKGTPDRKAAFTLYTIGLGTVKMLAPFLPHLAEEMFSQYYGTFVKDRSVHTSAWPEPGEKDADALAKGNLARNLIKEIRSWKSEKGIPLNQEVSKVELVIPDESLLEGVKDDIVSTLKIKELVIAKRQDMQEKIIAIKPKFDLLGPKFKKKAPAIVAELKKASPESVAEELQYGSYSVMLRSGKVAKITKEMLEIEKTATLRGEDVDSVTVGDCTAFMVR